MPAAPPELAEAVASGGTAAATAAAPPEFTAQVAAAADAAFTSALNEILLIGAIIAFAGALRAARARARRRGALSACARAIPSPPVARHGGRCCASCESKTCC